MESITGQTILACDLQASIEGLTTDLVMDGYLIGLGL